jgi:hypothetical protein
MTQTTKALMDRHYGGPRVATLAIVGLPGCGKTTLADKLGAALGLAVVHTDMYRDASWEVQPTLCMGEVACTHDSLVVEGLTVCRMFKRGFEPDAVIYILGSDPARTPKGLRTQLENGLNLYAGRIITLPKWPSLETALWALGGGTDDE